MCWNNVLEGTGQRDGAVVVVVITDKGNKVGPEAVGVGVKGCSKLAEHQEQQGRQEEVFWRFGFWVFFFFGRCRSREERGYLLFLWTVETYGGVLC